VQAVPRSRGRSPSHGLCSGGEGAASSLNLTSRCVVLPLRETLVHPRAPQALPGCPRGRQPGIPGAQAVCGVPDWTPAAPVPSPRDSCHHPTYPDCPPHPPPSRTPSPSPPPHPLPPPPPSPTPATSPSPPPLPLATPACAPPTRPRPSQEHCATACPTSPFELCEFHFQGYTSGVPEFSLRGIQGDEAVSPKILYRAGGPAW